MGSSHKFAYIVEIILGEKEKKLLNCLWYIGLYILVTDRQTDRQTDGQTDRQTTKNAGKNNMSPHSRGET